MITQPHMPERVWVNHTDRMTSDNNVKRHTCDLHLHTHKHSQPHHSHTDESHAEILLFLLLRIFWVFSPKRNETENERISRKFRQKIVVKFKTSTLNFIQSKILRSIFNLKFAFYTNPKLNESQKIQCTEEITWNCVLTISLKSDRLEI